MSNIWLEILQLPHNKVTNAIRILVGSVLPGFLIILMYSKEFFLRADVIKLTILSLSLTAPVIAFNYFLSLTMIDHAKGVVTGEDLKKFEDISDIDIFFGAFTTTGAVLFLSIIISYLLWFKRFFLPIVIIIAELLIVYGFHKAFKIIESQKKQKGKK